MSKYTMLRWAMATMARGAAAGYDTNYIVPAYFTNVDNDWTHQHWGLREALKDVFGVVERYGAFFTSCDQTDDVAILASFTQSALNEGRTGYANRCRHGHGSYEAYVACMLAHHPATFIYEEEIRTNPKLLEKYKMLLLVDITGGLPNDILAGLRAFQQKGGIIVADATTSQDLPADKRVDVTFHDYYNAGGCTSDMDSVEYCSINWVNARTFASRKAQALKLVFDDVAKPYAECKNPNLLLSTSASGDARIIFTMNDTPFAERFTAELQRPLPHFQQCWRIPVKEEILVRADAKSVIYDVFAGTRVATRPAGDGRVSFIADLTQISARAFVVVPAALDRPRLLADAKATQGSPLRLRAEILGGNGKQVSCNVPLEVVLRDSQGRERYRLYRTAQGGAWEDEIPVAANDPAGTWQVSVRELISGRQYDGEFEVAGAAPKLAETVLPRPTEILVDRQAIADFLKAKPELTIALSRDQARLRGLADKLLQAVNGAGAKAKIAWADELVTGNNYRAVWMQDPYRPVYQIKGHLVLLGTARDNFLIRELQESGILLRATSPAYPGPGGFIIELVRSAFYGDDNAILVMAEDDAALAKAADRLLALTGGYDPTASLEAARRNLLPADYRRTLKDAPVPATAGTRQEPPTKQIALKAADVVQPVLRRGESIRCLAASADGSMIVAGTDGYFDNLIALSGTGKLLWKAHLADRFIHQLAASADGKVVAAATTFPIRVHVLDGKGKLIRQYDNLQYGRWGAKFTTLYSENQYMAMSPDGTRIVLPERDQKLACYAIADGKKLWEIPYKPENGKFRRFAHSLAFAPDSSTVAAAFITCSTDPKIIEQHMKVAPELMDDATKAEDRQLKPRLWIVDARAGSLASEKIEDPASDPRMLYWDEWMSEYTRFLGTPRTDLPMERLTRLPGVLGEDIAFAANKVAVACGGMPCGGAFVYDRAADTRASFHGLESAVRLSPDGKLVGGFNGSDLIVYDTATGNHWRAGAHEAVSDARISNDQVAACWWDGSLKVFSSKGDLLWQRDVGAGSVILATPAGWVVGNNLGSLRLFDPKGKEKWAADLNTIAIPEQAPAPRAKRSLPEKTEKRIVLQAKDVSLQTRPWGDISQAITGLDVAVAKDKLQFAFDAPWTGRFALSPSLVQGEGFGKVTVEVDGKAVGEMPLRAAGEVGPADGLKPLSVALQKGKHSVAISAAAGKSVGVEFVSLDAITRDVRSWLVLGPFDNPSIKFYDEGYADGPRKNFDEEQPVEKEIKDGKIDAAKVFTGKKNREVKWLRTADVQGSVDAASGWINLWAMLKVDGNMDLGYAAATVQSPEELTLATWWMWNHGLKIFANGAPVFGERTGNPPGGGGKLRRIDLPLRKGLNQILVKTDIGGVWWQEWGFSVQAAQVEGVEFRLPQ